MSLKNVNFLNLLQTQYIFKLNMYRDMFTSLVILQIISIVLSLNGMALHGSGINRLMVYVTEYSADAVVGFTHLWGFVFAILLTTKANREVDFTFVTNRLSQHLANFSLLLTASVIGGITAFLSSFLVKLIIQYTNISVIQLGDVEPTFVEMFMGLVAIILYLFLFCVLGYTLGTIIQLHPYVVIILPISLVGLFIFLTQYNHEWFIHLTNFYTNESSFIMFVVKTMVTMLVCIFSTILISHRKEVRL